MKAIAVQSTSDSESLWARKIPRVSLLTISVRRGILDRCLVPGASKIGTLTVPPKTILSSPVSETDDSIVTGL